MDKCCKKCEDWNNDGARQCMNTACECHVDTCIYPPDPPPLNLMQKEASGLLEVGTENWAQDLKKKYPIHWGWNSQDMNGFYEIQDFLRQTIQAEREKAFMAGNKVWDGKWEAAKAAERSRIVGIVEKIKKVEAIWPHQSQESLLNKQRFNRDMDSLITRIKE